MNTSTNLEDFLEQKKKEEEMVWKDHAFNFIKNANDSEIISFIENNFFSAPKERTGEIVDLSFQFPVNSKRDLKMMSLIYESDDIIDQVRSMHRSFNAKSFEES
jgi:hypothetical protein